MRGKARRDHGSTAHDAADAIDSISGRQRMQVLTAIRGAGYDGLTDEEAQRLCDMNPSSQRPRRVELVEAKLVYDSGRTRLTASKRHAVVWVAQETMVQRPLFATETTVRLTEYDDG